MACEAFPTDMLFLFMHLQIFFSDEFFCAIFTIKCASFKILPIVFFPWVQTMSILDMSIKIFLLFEL